MSKKLSNTEIKKRLTRLVNLEKMYANQIEKNKKLKNQVKKLKQENADLKRENKELRARVQKLELIVEELQKMIFKKGKRSSDFPTLSEEKKTKKKRTKASYRRPIPKEKSVTDTEEYPLDGCDCCGGELCKLQVTIRYVEDMNLPLNGQFELRKVIKQEIWKGYCKFCKKRSSGKNIAPQHCVLGEGVKSFVVYAITVLQLSYDQLSGFLETMVDLCISDGEIVNILKKSSVNLQGEYEAMKGRIREGPGAHYDETVRDVQSGKEKRYAWVMADLKGEERVYLLGSNRGGGNAEFLKGDSMAVGISDDYGAYRKLFSHHQLCRAHPIRKVRDLVCSKKLTKLQIEQCKITYEKMRDLHNKISIHKGMSISVELTIKLMQQFDEMTYIYESDPEKMVKIKESLVKNKSKYFTCLNHEGIPTTNNTAERVLRPLVIKRKLCFGSKTADGARMMEVVYSVVYSLLAKSRINFFDRYLTLLA